MKKPYIGVSIEQNSMAAYLQVETDVEDNYQVDIQELFEMALERLQEKGVKYGIDEASVRDAVSVRRGEKVLVAVGKPVEEGKDAIITYHYLSDKEKAGRPQEREDGTVDFWDLNLINNVRAGDILATKTPSVSGSPGITVTGQIIKPKPVKNPSLRRGKNTSLENNGLKLVATRDGHVVTTADGVISVLPVLTVNGNVDVATGNISFIGDIVIQGSVKPGFAVRAEKNIEVMGNVEGGSLLAGGSITVRGGIIGQGKHRVVAGGNLSARFIENGMVQAKGDILINDAILNSIVIAGGRIQVEGRRGTIVGGETRATFEIKAKNIGSSLTPLTQLEVGVKPEWKEELKKIQADLKSKTKDLEKSRQVSNMLFQLKRTKGELPKNKQETLERLQFTEQQLEREIAEGQMRKRELEEKLSMLTTGKIKVQGTIYPGVTVVIGNITMSINDPLHYCQLVVEDDEIKIHPY